MTDTFLPAQIAAAARAMREEKTPGLTMDTAVTTAREIVVAADEAGISMCHPKRGVSTEAATSDAVRRVDELQDEHREGPCLDTIFRVQVASSPDLATDHRWPTWGRRVAEETGLRSMLCFRLFTDTDTLGALSLYSFEVDAFDDDDKAHGLTLALNTSMAVSAAQDLDNVQVALDSRLVIGQASGILMERFGLSPDRAFQVLIRVSSHTNTKLRLVAEDIVRTGIVPSTPATSRHT